LHGPIAQSLSFAHAPPALDDALAEVEVAALEATLDDTFDEALAVVVLPTVDDVPRAPPVPDEALEDGVPSVVDGTPPAPPVLDEPDGLRSAKSPSTCAQDSVTLGARIENATAERA
jgi:hypothetical protein